MTLFLVVSQGGPPGSVDDIIDPASPVRCLNYRASYVQVNPRSGHGTHGRVALARQDPRPGHRERRGRRQPNIPFGGIGASGTGARFGGTANLDAFTDTRWVTVRGDIAPYPF